MISCSEALRRSMTILSKFKNVFTIRLEETPAMKYLGLSIIQKLDGIYMDTDRYLQVPSTNSANSISNANVQTIFLANKCVRKAIGWTVRSPCTFLFTLWHHVEQDYCLFGCKFCKSSWPWITGCIHPIPLWQAWGILYHYLAVMSSLSRCQQHNHGWMSGRSRSCCFSSASKTYNQGHPTQGCRRAP